MRWVEPSADETKTTTTELTNTTASLVATAIQVDSENPTPVDDYNGPLEPGSQAKVQLTKSIFEGEMNADVENEEQSDHEQEMDADNVGGEDKVKVQVYSTTDSKKTGKYNHG